MRNFLNFILKFSGVIGERFFGNRIQFRFGLQIDELSDYIEY